MKSFFSRTAVSLAAFTTFITLASLFTACLPGDPALDQTGDLIKEDIVVGTGATVSLDTLVVTQAEVLLSERLANGTVTRSTSNIRVLLDNFTTVQGLDMGMRGMRVGGQRRITVPPRLGYGNRQQGPVPPNSTVIFDVRLDKTELFTITDLTIGTGDSVRFNSFVAVTYVGRLLNGNTFDATRAGDPPFTFRVGAGNVIRGWEVGLLGMKPGGRRRLVIPSLLGYAERQQGIIPPNSTLVFEIELLSVTN